MISGYIRPLVDLGYWLNPVAVPFIDVVSWVLLALMGLSFVGGIFAYFFQASKPKDKDVRHAWRRLGTLLMWAGGTGLALWFFTWQLVPYLSMRIWWLVWAIGYGYWAWVIYRYFRVEIPKKHASADQDAEYQKWLPKPKK